MESGHMQGRFCEYWCLFGCELVFSDLKCYCYIAIYLIDIGTTRIQYSLHCNVEHTLRNFVTCALHNGPRIEICRAK
jgi:hypothetical protein